MKQYEVRSTTQANEHVLNYAEYIQNELFNPQDKPVVTARRHKAADRTSPVNDYLCDNIVVVNDG